MEGTIILKSKVRRHFTRQYEPCMAKELVERGYQADPSIVTAQVLTNDL